MRTYLLLMALLALIALSTGCARTYQAPTTAAAVARHDRIAILPPAVTYHNRVQLKGGKSTAELEREAGRELQEALFGWILDRQQKGKLLTVKVQDPRTTNAKLENLGYFSHGEFGNRRLAEMLGVDAVLIADFDLDRLLSNHAARAIGLLTDNVPIPRRQGRVRLRLYDYAEDATLWNYSRDLSRNYGESPEAIINGVMRRASKKLPYRIDKNA